MYNERKIKEKNAAFKEFLSTFNTFRANFSKENPSCQATFFPILRLILPQVDRARESYGLKDIALGKLLIKVLAINENGTDGQLLKTAKLGDNRCDFGDVVFKVMQDRASGDSALSVVDINRCLDELADSNQQNNRAGMEAALTSCYPKMSALEAKWFTRIILKDLRIGLSPNQILNCLHPEGADIFKSLNSLELICDRIEGDKDVGSLEIQLFVPFKPQLCARINSLNLDELFRATEFFVETKMDGERQQLHRRGDSYQYFTRQGFNASSWFGENPNSGKLTPNIHSLFKIKIEDLILDGEMMVC